MTIPLRPASADVPVWRREPYRLLFPLGVVLAWTGVLHWLLLATGVIAEYRSIFHAFAQIEGFMTCFAVGFLFTLIPRRTSTAEPAAWQMAVAMVAPVVIDGNLVTSRVPGDLPDFCKAVIEQLSKAPATVA